MESFAFPVLLCGFLVLALAHFFKVNNDVRHVEQRLMQVQSELSTRLEQLEKETSKQQENITSTLSDVKKEFEMNDFVSEVESRQFIGLMENVNKLAIRMREYQQDTLETSDKIKNLENDLRRVDKQMSTILLADIHDMLLMSDYVKNLEERLVQEQTKLSEKVAELAGMQDVLNARLEKLERDTSKRDEDILERLSEVKVEAGLVDKITLLQKIVELTETSDELSAQVRQLLEKTLETSEKVTDVENDVRRVDQQMGTILSVQAEHTIDIQQLKKSMLNHSNETENSTAELQSICNPECQNGGVCSKNNTCKCKLFFGGDRCQNGELQCGLGYDGDNSTGSGDATGSDSSALVLPFAAALYKNQSDVYFCDGSIIHQRFVLTSAWCIEYYIGSASSISSNKLKEVAVKVGLSDLKHRTYLQEHHIRSVHIHPDYDNGVFGDYNIALLEMEKPIEYNFHIRPVCLPPKEKPEVNQFYRSDSSVRTITLSSYIDSLSATSLKNIDAVMQTSDACKRRMFLRKAAKYFPSTHRAFCADSKSEFSCSDFKSGSPVMQSQTTQEGKLVWTQVGILSNWWCKKDYDIIASHVQNLMPWVADILEAATKR